jgi:hypothetical protein
MCKNNPTATTAEARRLTGNGNIRRCTIGKLPPKGEKYYSKTLVDCCKIISVVEVLFAQRWKLKLPLRA